LRYISGQVNLHKHTGNAIAATIRTAREQQGNIKSDAATISSTQRKASTTITTNGSIAATTSSNTQIQVYGYTGNKTKAIAATICTKVQ
jgi:hypothetical protein